MAFTYIAQSKLTMIIHHEHEVEHLSGEHHHDHHRPCDQDNHEDEEDHKDEHHPHSHYVSLDLPVFTLQQKFPSLIVPAPAFTSYASLNFIRGDDPSYGILKPPQLV